MVDLLYYLITLMLFDISLLYYQMNLRSSTIFCHVPGGLYLSTGITLACLVLTVPELFYDENLEIFFILLETLLPIKLPVASAILCIIFLEIVLSTCVADCLA